MQNQMLGGDRTPTVLCRNSNRRLGHRSVPVNSQAPNILETAPPQEVDTNFPITLPYGHVINFDSMALEIYDTYVEDSCASDGWFSELWIKARLEEVFVAGGNKDARSWYYLQLQPGNYGNDQYGTDIVGCPFPYGDLYNLAGRHNELEDQFTNVTVEASHNDSGTMAAIAKSIFPTEICIGTAGVAIIWGLYILWVRSNRKKSRQTAREIQASIEIFLQEGEDGVTEIRERIAAENKEGAAQIARALQQYTRELQALMRRKRGLSDGSAVIELLNKHKGDVHAAAEEFARIINQEPPEFPL